MILNLDDENEIVSTCVNLHLQVGFRVRSRNFIKGGGAISAKNTFALKRLYPPPLLKFIRCSGVAITRCLIFMPPLKKGAYCFATVGRYVGRSDSMLVCRSIVQVFSAQYLLTPSLD